MRIITGIYRGRHLATVPDRSVRPVTDRVKSTIFNMLQNRLRLDGARILDLFAGSGSLGFEALSRGAATCVFVDTSNPVLTILEENSEALGCAEACEMIQDDALSFIEHSSQPYDLIFADPPYAFAMTSDLPSKIFQKKLLRPEGYLIIEHHKTTVIPSDGLFSLAAQKRFGSTLVSFFTHPHLKKDQP